MARALTSATLTGSTSRLIPPTMTYQESSLDTIENIIKALEQPLGVMLAQVKFLQQMRSSAEQANSIALIQQLSSEIATAVNKLSYVAPILPETTTMDLQNVPVLLIEDNNPYNYSLFPQLQSFGLQCTKVETSAALATLRSAEQAKQPYQIVIISAHNLDHHISYLARTIKANSLLSPSMLALALGNELPAFEQERAYFDGFACILNPAQSVQLLEKLANSWRGWAAKINFSRNEILPTHHRILLVEDEPIPQKVTQRQLEELGYQVEIAPDGHTALRLLGQNFYDLVFMDVGLPDISGLEVTAEIRKREGNTHHTPIIGLTAFALPSDQESGLQAGMDEYLVKPLLPECLNAVLKCWFPKKQHA